MNLWNRPKFRNNRTNPSYRVIRNPSRLFSILKLLLTWHKIYFDAQKNADPAKARVVETSLDDRIPIKEQAIYAYLFACVYSLYIAWYLIDKLSDQEFRLAYQSFDFLFKEAGKIFVSHPTRMKDRSRTVHPLTTFTHQFDGPTNCFPSLHVAIAMLSFHIIRDATLNNDLLAYSAMRKSCIDICRSTMEVKQHSIADVVGGYALASISFNKYYNKPFENLMQDILPEFANSTELNTTPSLNDPDELISLLDQLIRAANENSDKSSSSLSSVPKAS